MERTRVVLTVPSGVDVARVVGEGDAVLRCIEGAYGADVALRGDRISLSGDAAEVEQIARLFSYLFESARAGEHISVPDVRHLIDAVARDGFDVASLRDDVLVTYRGRAVRPKTAGQRRYVDAVRQSAVTVCEGPAGTGKTYLAVAMAVAAWKRREASRIVLTRPVVEAGESLGYLPGTLEEKVDPYVRPLYDALFDMLEGERVAGLVEQGAIEVAPLAYMRGRTLNDAFVILDEAQNTTPEQMKMFLTRLGFNSRFVVTGDASQRDLVGKRSALATLEDILGGVEGISFVRLDRKDVVRHALVGRIVDAYEAYDAREEKL